MVDTIKSPYILTIKKVKNDNKISFLNKKINKNTNNTVNIKNKKKFSPLSGSELKYEPKLWNKNNLTKTSHNCYSYALGKIVKGLSSKAQPG